MGWEVGSGVAVVVVLVASVSGPNGGAFVGWIVVGAFVG